VTTKNALLTSISIFVDLTTIHVTLHFKLVDGTQKTGPFKLTDELLRAITEVTDEREILNIKDRPCRVQTEEYDDEIISFGHFLKKEQWFSLSQQVPTIER
jgi:predicted DNA-binding protein (MmcQ/YjbR family)